MNWKKLIVSLLKIIRSKNSYLSAITELSRMWFSEKVKISDNQYQKKWKPKRIEIIPIVRTDSIKN